MAAPEVEGATGYIDTNFEGKARAAVEELKTAATSYIFTLRLPTSAATETNPKTR